MHLISKKSSLSDGFQKQRASFIKDEVLSGVFFFLNQEKMQNLCKLNLRSQVKDAKLK